jgi:hypothetical protein
MGDRPAGTEIEYFIKWKGKSYLHVSWEPASFLNEDSAMKAKLNRYVQQVPGWISPTNTHRKN